MKSKLFILVLTMAAFVAVVIANPETYRIRVQYNTNLRASNSLDSAVLASAPAGTTLQVVGQVENWLQINRAGALYWMAAWVNHSRVEDPVPAQPAGNVPSNIDNCCQVDRQCHSDQDWTNGYWAYQNGQCSNAQLLGSQSVVIPPGTDAQLLGSQSIVIPPGTDNFCGVTRECHSEADWVSGWLAFQHFQCQSPPATKGIEIKGSPQFVSQVSNALQLLQDRAPQWWKYSTCGLNTIKMVPEGSPSNVNRESKTYEETLSEVLKKGTGEAGLVYIIFGIVHEACHVNEDHLHKDGLDEEKACTQASLYALQTINPADDAGTIDWLKWIIANIHDPEVQWW